ncbi:monovalent cation:H+ antiporter, CPA1 family [Nocardioides terrae]|uniref:Monovalent cation:H+ antiporter, CPA1 family n=1 Tax=Nocardioides terrae TaxID=574651 RepID=A0A1I1DY12_9ACTN|nr:sodium:proton antiporter [Nocardioides terrae]SFB79272.1 monovalent cation:H+ antiporter, CPA1 family [Nocardioides terrae]
MDIALIAVIGVCCIVAVENFAARLGVAAPLLLVLTGVVGSWVPGVPHIEVEPHLILGVVLPPLLYSAAVSMPAMEFRRDFRAISGLSVVLVVLSALAIGVFLDAAIPGIGLATGIAVGAIISPTDAVATSIARRLGVPPRVLAVLDGESLLNDATALVLLRSAVAAAGVSLMGVLGDFVYAVAVAAAVGALIGVLHLRVRAHVAQAPAGTAISFAVPFLAYLPVEHLGGSGLVAAVTAGLITGQGSPRYLSPAHRLSEAQNWRTVEFLLEGAIFLLMGLQLRWIVEDADGLSRLWVAPVAALIVVLVRAAYVAPLLGALDRRAERADAQRGRLEAVGERLESGDFPRREPRNDREAAHIEKHSGRRLEMLRTRVRRGLADIDYLAGAPMGAREGAVLVWAGMRGAVTVAAAQTLPDDTPQRSLLVLVAFAVAAGTLLVQGGTLPWLVRRLGLATSTPAGPDPDHGPLMERLVGASRAMLDDPSLRRADGSAYDPEVLALLRRREPDPEDPEVAADRVEQYTELRLRAIGAMRESLLDARDDGVYASSTLEAALRVLDAEEITTEVRAGRV